MSASRIIIIRHAEKTGLENDVGLSVRGELRATALSKALPLYFGRIHQIVAAQSTERSARPLRTVEPLASALHLSINQDWKTGEFQKLAAALMSASQFEGQVVVCWRHKTLSDLAQALGAPQAPPWPQSEYDWSWVIERQQEITTFTALLQRLDGKELDITAGAPEAQSVHQ